MKAAARREAVLQRQDELYDGRGQVDEGDVTMESLGSAPVEVIT